MVYKYDYLCEPETFASLTQEKGALKSTSGVLYENESGIPILYPQDYRYFLQQSDEQKLAMAKNSSRAQYFYLSWIKQTFSQHNSLADCHDYKKYKILSQEFLADLEGSVLDIGCDTPSISSSFLPKDVEYIGLDPLVNSNDESRIIGFVEFLPIKTASVDNITFMTSLDHVFDYHQAIAEAVRVLKPKGKIVIATLIWSDNAELIHDNVHFHHFRLSQVLSVLQNFKILKVQNHSWKNNNYRSLYFLKAEKL